MVKREALFGIEKIAIMVFLCAKLSFAVTIDFNAEIRPILSDKCFSCHGLGKDRKADLRLDSFEGATDPNRKGGAVIQPGNSEASEFYKRLITTDTDELMPPEKSHKHLTKHEIALLKDWIDAGANYDQHWAFKALKNEKTSVNDEEWIDAYVLDKLSAMNLNPSPKADKRTLLRRLSLDLIGLPPTIEEMRLFLEDQSPQAYQKQVERLLASPHYGEHRARYWLDLVRYGDTHGLHADNYREMYLYRDWVIKAFDKNEPFDDFVIEQIAGDMLDNPTEDQWIASGFNRLHISNSAGSALKEELYVNNVTDRVNAFGTVFMGLTLGCATCHDHKYDPITQKEYYQLFAFFNNMDGPPDNDGVKNPAPFLTFPTPVQLQVKSRYEAQLKSCNIESDKKVIRKQLEVLNQDIVTTMIMKEQKEIRPAYILNRGAYDQPGEKVERSTPSFLPAMKDLPKNRWGLAKWVTSKDHPLLARVTVNRLWQQLFGMGLCKTSEDFGSQGEMPSHPELLDALAYKFIDSGWDVKRMLYLMVMSETYQQSSAVASEAYKLDPDNKILARGPRFRMDAEMLRDQALFASGLLVDKKFGPSVKVPQPKGLWTSVALEGSNTNKFVADEGENIYRRSVYSFWKRSYPPPAMTIFNAPSREICVARRERTNTPLQALVLMNEEQFFKAAEVMAELTMRQDVTFEERLRFMYERITSNLPKAEEIFYIKKSYEEQISYGSEMLAWTMIANSIFNLDKVKSKG